MDHPRKGITCTTIIPFKKNPLCRGPAPWIVIRKSLCQLLDRGLARIPLQSQCFSLGPKSPDPPVFLPLVQPILLLEKPGNCRIVLDDLTIHIDDVKCSIRTDPQIHWPEPLVGGGKKFGLLLTGCPPGPVTGTIPREDRAMHDVERRLTVKQISMILIGEEPSPVERCTAPPRKVIAVSFALSVELHPGRIPAPLDTPRMRFTDPITVTVISSSLG